MASQILTLGLGGAIAAAALSNFELFETYIPFWYISVPFVFDIFYQQAVRSQGLELNTLTFYSICFLKRTHKFILISAVYFHTYLHNVQNFIILLKIWTSVGIVFYLVPFRWWQRLMEQILPFRLIVVLCSLIYIGGEERFFQHLIMDGRAPTVIFSNQLTEYLSLSFFMGILSPIIDTFLSRYHLSKRIPLSKAIQSSLNWGLGGIIAHLARTHFDSFIQPTLGLYNLLLKSDHSEFVRRVHFAYYCLLGGYRSYIPAEEKKKQIVVKSAGEEQENTESKSGKKDDFKKKKALQSKKKVD